MHDNYIVEYSVNIGKKDILIKTYNDIKRENGQIHFSEVLTHFFKCIIDYNIVSDIVECDICNFVSDNKDELIKMEGYCWPIDYLVEQELIDFLVINQYKYIKINSSYGMFGWVLAKHYSVESE